MYRCIESFCVDKYDGDGFHTGESEVIEMGSLWSRDDDINVIGGEVHLESVTDNLQWLEIPFETLSNNFKERDKE